MKKLIKKILLKWLNKNQGKILKQNLYEYLHSLTISGMNYGGGGNYKDSGELYVIDYIKSKYPEKTKLIIFDVGGNIGGYSKKLSEVFKPPSVIHAFEPSKITFELFKKTTNGVQNIIANNCGVSDVVSNKILFADEAGSEMASVYKRDLRFFGMEMKNEEVVSFVTLDNYCIENNIIKIHFLKMDIEGHELNALRGATNLIENDAIDFIQFEFGGCNIDSRTFFKDFYLMLFEKYKIFRIVKDGLFEIKNYKETYEIFTTVNYLAQRKDFNSNN